MTEQEKQEIDKIINEIVDNTRSQFDLKDPKVRDWIDREFKKLEDQWIDREFEKFEDQWRNQKRRLKHE